MCWIVSQETYLNLLEKHNIPFNKLTYVLVATVLLVGCSNREAYNAIQINSVFECQTRSPDEYKKCMQKPKESYESYEKKRKKLISPN